MEHYSNRGNEIFNLGVDELGKAYMHEIARWAKFLAIIGFIFSGLLCLGLIFLIFGASAISAQLGAAYGMSYGVGMFFFYILIILIFLYPSITLLRFANRVKPALQTANTDLFNEALKNLKNTFKFMGIYMIVMLGIYGLIIIFAVIAAAVAGA
jgi:hypothetical protein